MAYYNFVRFGHEGYRYIMETIQANARGLAKRISEIGEFELIGDDGAEQLPLVAFQLAGEHSYHEFDVASQLAAERGWMVPAYTLPPNADHVTIMRALVKLTLSHTLAQHARRRHRPGLRDAREEGRPTRARPQAGQDRHGLLNRVQRRRQNCPSPCGEGTTRGRTDSRAPQRVIASLQPSWSSGPAAVQRPLESDDARLSLVPDALLRP